LSRRRSALGGALSLILRGNKESQPLYVLE
jgi:hypothetical protein